MIMYIVTVMTDILDTRSQLRLTFWTMMIHGQRQN